MNHRKRVADPVVELPYEQNLPLFRRPTGGKSLVALDDGTTQFELGHDLPGQRRERERLLLGELARLIVEDAEGAQRQPFGGFEQSPCIEA